MASPKPSPRWAPRLVLLLPVSFAVLAWWVLAGSGTPPPEAPPTLGSDPVPEEGSEEARGTAKPAVRPARLAPGVAPRATDARYAVAASRQPRVEIESGGVRGRVLSAAGDPVADAHVSVRPDPGGDRPLSARAASLAEAQTQEDGTFRLDPLPPGACAVWAEAEGHGAAWRRGVGAGMRVVLRLSEAGHLRVRIVDAERNPVAGAEAHYLTEGYVRAGKAGPDGWAELRDLPVGPASVVVRGARGARGARGNLAHTTGRITAGETTTLECVLTEGVLVHGEVRERKSGRPIPTALVHIAYRDRPDLASEPVETDTEGRFEVGPVPSGGWGAMLVAEGEGYATASLDLDRGHLEVERPFLRVPLWRQARIEGRVFDTAGFPVGGARVGWTQDGAAREATKPPTVITDPRGRFRLPLPHDPDEHRGHAIAAEGPDGSYGAARVRGADLPDAQIHVILRGSGRLIGTVRDALGRVCNGVFVVLEPDAAGMTVGAASVSESWARYRALAEDSRDSGRLRAATNPDGTYHLASVPTGEYRIRLESLDNSIRLPRRVRIASGDTRLDLTLDTPGSITGEVVGPRGEAVAGALVTARPTGSERGLVSGVSAASGADGRFLLEGLRGNGAWRLTAQADGYVPACVEGVNSEAGGVELRLAAGHTIRGTVVWDEQPFRGGIRVLLTPTRGVGVDDRQPVRTAALARLSSHGVPFRARDGTFALEAIPPGTFVLEVRSQDGRLTALPTPLIVAEGRQTDAFVLRLQACGRIEGTVLEAKTREPACGALVTLRPGDDDGRNPFPPVTARTNGRGAYVLSEVPPGRYRLEVLSPGARPYVELVDVEGSEASRCDLVLTDVS